jgi:hypothetical protein
MEKNLKVCLSGSLQNAAVLRGAGDPRVRYYKTFHTIALAAGAC